MNDYNAQNKNSEPVLWNLKQVDSIIAIHDKIVIVYGYFCSEIWKENIKPAIDFFKDRNSVPVYFIFSYDKFYTTYIDKLNDLYRSYEHLSFIMLENFYNQKPINSQVYTKFRRKRHRIRLYNNQIFNNNITGMPFIQEEFYTNEPYIDFSNYRATSLYYLFRGKKIFYTNPQALPMFSEEAIKQYVDFINE